MATVDKAATASTDAHMFLSMLGESHTFQTFDDSDKRRRNLSRVLHGNLPQHASKLARLNGQGAGVFVMVNEGDGKGRCKENVLGVRAQFVDMDGAPFELLKSAPLRPHLIIESSANRWHAYWLVRDAPLAQFGEVQGMLAELFQGDPKVCDPPRVMRVPGFDHRKRSPFRTRIVDIYNAPPYSNEEFLAAFGIEKARTLSDVIPEGARNSTLFGLARGLVRQGQDAEAVRQRLQLINNERCGPPLSDTEVQAIAANAVARGSQGYIQVPHALLDSPQWRSLTPAEHDIVLTAFRLYNSRNNGRLAVTWELCRRIRGCADQNSFYRHRARVIESGILKLVSEGRQTQRGRTPDLFAIASEWLTGKTLGQRKRAKG